MLYLQNDLGWRLYKHKTRYVIRQAHPPLRSRIWQFGLVFIIILFIVCLWVGRDRALQCILCAVPALLILLWLAGIKNIKRYVIAFAPPLLIFMGLLARDDFTIYSFLGALPLALVLSLTCFRPTVLYISVRSGLVSGSGFYPQLPFSELEIEIDQSQETGRYGVYIKNAKIRWECLVWESCTEDEASVITDKFRAWGIGASHAKDQEQVIKADKKIRIIIMAGYIVATLATPLWIACMVLRSENSPENIDMQVLIRNTQIALAILIFLYTIPLGVYLCWFGRRSIKNRRIPPPRTIVIMNTKILEGDRAVTRGQVWFAIGLVLILLGLAAGIFLPYKIKKLYGQNPLKSPESEYEQTVGNHSAINGWQPLNPMPFRMKWMVSNQTAWASKLPILLI